MSPTLQLIQLLGRIPTGHVLSTVPDKSCLSITTADNPGWFVSLSRIAYPVIGDLATDWKVDKLSGHGVDDPGWFIRKTTETKAHLGFDKTVGNLLAFA